MNQDSYLNRRLHRRSVLALGTALAAGVVTPLLSACSISSNATPTPQSSGGNSTSSQTASSNGSPAASSAAATSTSYTGQSSANAIATANAGKTPKSGGTLVWGMGGDADALDPHTTNAWAAWRQATMMYESLVRKDLLSTTLDVPIVPLLAEKWEIAGDAKTYTFTLRQGVKFHDGTDFNADAVKANYERNAVPDSKYYYKNAWHGSVAFAHVGSVDTPSANTFVFNMKDVFVEFLAAIGDYYWFGIASPTQILKVGNDNLATNPSGTGPFTFVERVPGDHTTFARNENYWGDKAYLDKVIVKPILDDSARTVALQNGEVDLMSDPQPDVIQSLVDGGFKLSEGPASQVAYYDFNFNNEHGGNVKVRQAINYALNRDAIAHDLFRDHVIPAYGIHTPGAPAYDPNWKPFTFDPAKAKQLLTEAGYPNGFQTKILAAPTASGWPLAGATAQMIVSNLKDIGIDAGLELTEWVTYLGLDMRKRTDAIMWGTAWGMPTNFFLNIITESTYNSESNTFNDGYNTTEHPRKDVDDILQSAAQETDPQKSIQLYRQANQKVCVDDAAKLCINHDKMPHLMKKSVMGFVHAVNVNYDLSKVWLDQ